MPRPGGLKPGEMREVSITAGVNPYAEGSAICRFGRTEVLCTASLEVGAPAWMSGQGRGWVTAEYAMLPRSTHTRTSRDASRGGRAREISRLIGRSLRQAVDMNEMGERTVRIDCDVLVADGGTRTAAISGGYVALAQALAMVRVSTARQIAALSLGRVDGRLVTDLCYEEDSTAELDLNLVLAPGGQIIEVQATGERGSFTGNELQELIIMGETAAQNIFAAQNAALGM
jgi:ribonuclease PH